MSGREPAALRTFHPPVRAWFTETEAMREVTRMRPLPNRAGPQADDPARWLPIDPLARPRGRGALLVTREGRVAMAVEGRGRRITVAGWMTEVDVTAAATALLAHLRVSRALAARPGDVVVETIDRLNAAAMRWTESFLKAGFRRETSGLRGF